MKTNYLLLTATALTISSAAFSQRVATPRARQVTGITLTNTDRAFVQDAINSNNEAMAIAQMALQQSKKIEVQQIAGQVLNDHIAAQKRLYALANLKEAVPYSRVTIPSATTGNKIPVTDNLNNRRTRTIASITDDQPANATQPAATNNGNTVAGATTGRQPSRTGFDTTGRNSVNQTYNGITSIDNANGVNNANRTDVGSYSGRWSENNTVANSQNPQVYANQPVTNQFSRTAPLPGTNTTVVNDSDNAPYFPNRVTDTVRMTGSSDGFQNPGTNLSFPGNERYSRTTPATNANNNTGSDYGYTGVVPNNAQTNALNTAPYSNNQINGNTVQTGRLQGTANPAAVINSSTASMTNNNVGFNNSNTSAQSNTTMQVQNNGTMVADNSTAANIANTANTTNNSVPAAANSNSNAPMIAGRAGNNTNNTNNNNGATNATGATIAGSTTSGNSAFQTATGNTEGITTLRNVQAADFDKQWAMQMVLNQQAATQKYQTALKRTRQPQLRLYMNAIIPILQGHQYALQQWQAKQ